MAQLGNLIVNGVSRLLSKLYVSDSVTAPNFIGKLTGNADTATKLTSSAGSATQPVYFSDGKPVATTYTLGKSVPASAVFTDTNTWRGIQNNLTSDATDQSLSAAQGKVLKGLVDGKAPSGHTHDDRYYTESEIDSKLSGKANNHSHPYLPLAGGTMSGTITFADIGDKGTSAGLFFNGSMDGAGIYYQTTAADQGNLVLNLTDDDNCYLRIAKNGVFKSYFSPDGVFHGSVAGNASSASSVAWGNVTDKPSTFTPSSHTHNYAGSSSAGGAATSANKVNAALTINLNGTSQGAWDGSSAKSISITAASVGATSVTISRW